MSDDADRLWAFDHCDAYHLPGERMLVRNRRTGRQAILTPEVHAALELCGDFQTLEAHAGRLCARAPWLQGQEAAVLQALESVRDDGLLIAADIFALELAPAPGPLVPLDKPVVAVITWERPEALERCLESIAENCAMENVAEFFVIDDSRDPDSRDRNRASTDRFAGRLSGGGMPPVRYLGAPEQGELLERLVREAPGLESSIRFLADRERWTDHWTSGLARTLALLVSAGRRLLVLDDDILCQVFDPPERRGGIRFDEDPREARFFPDTQSWAELRSERGTDPFLRHLSCLGATLPDALGNLGLSDLGPAAFTGARRDFVETLSPRSRILVTECGSLGDPGTSSIEWLAWLEDESLEALLDSEESVATALRERNCWLGRSRPRFLDHGTISQLTGIDNRVLLPPYIPVMRGEDRLFGDMVSFLHPGSVALDQPWAVPHLPIPPRKWTEADGRVIIHPTFPNFAMTLPPELRATPTPGGLLRRYDRLARYYEDLAELDDEALLHQFHDQLIASRTETYRQLTELLESRDDAPAAWQAFLSDGLRRLDQQLLQDPSAQTVTGYPASLRGPELLAWWRDFWRQFALALRAWPEIHLAARRALAREP